MMILTVLFSFWGLIQPDRVRQVPVLVVPVHSPESNTSLTYETFLKSAWVEPIALQAVRRPLGKAKAWP